MSNGPRSQRRKINTGEIVTLDTLNEMGADAQVSAFDGVASALFAIANGTALVSEGGGFIGRGCHPKLGGSALVVTIEPGAGFFDRETTGSVDPTAEAYLHSPMFIPFQLLTAATVTLGAHHATLPRYDIITMAVAESDDDSDTIRERVAGPGTQAIATRNTRTKWAPTFTATAGTADASPTVPSTPAGRLLVATVYVPATSGNVVVTDSRRQVQFGYGLGEPTYPHYAYPAVQSGLGVTAGSGLTVNVASGYTGSPRRYFEAKTLTMTVSVVDPVIHLIYANGADGIAVAYGTPAATPAEPATPSGATPLAYVTLAASASSISSGDIEDLTMRGPYRASMMEIPIAFLDVSAAAMSGNDRVFTIQAVDASGRNLARVVTVEVCIGTPGFEPFDNSVTLMSGTVTTGTELRNLNSSGTFGAPGIYNTNASGLLVVTMSTTVHPTNAFFTFKPVVYVNAGTSALATPRQCYRPGGSTLYRAEWT